MTHAASTISVIICAYTEKRWNDLIAAIASVKQQTLAPAEIIIVIDHNPALLRQIQAEIAGVIAMENREARGLRGARNSGIAVARSQLIAFLDDDAVAHPDWLGLFYEGCADPRVFSIGGAVKPLWEGTKPRWLPEEFYWVVGCTYQGMPETDAMIRNPIGANMAFRREVFEMIGDFRSEVACVGCEETELCIRVRQHWPQNIVLYRPEASVLHHVAASRTTWSYFCTRCYNEGLWKAIVTRSVGAKDSLASERSYTVKILPQGIVRNLAEAFVHHDLSGFARAGTIIAGLAVTTTGYVVGSIFPQIAKARSHRVRVSGDNRKTWIFR